MKFISKSSNLLIVLRQGIPGSHITGTPSRPMISARFKDGVFASDDQGIVDMLMAHPGCGSDFISAEDTLGVDPYAYMREGNEPEHVVTKMEFGQPKGSGNAPKIKFPPEVKKAMQDQALEMAKEMAKQMAPAFAAEYLKNALADREATKVITDTAENTVQKDPVKAVGKKRGNSKDQAE